MFIESLFLVLLIYFLFYIFYYKIEIYMDVISSYECGFDLKSESRLMFSYKFFLISILFIIFDVEISLMVPVPFLMIKELGLFVFFNFILILIIGMLYEYYYGSLDWLDYYN